MTTDKITKLKEALSEINTVDFEGLEPNKDGVTIWAENWLPIHKAAQTHLELLPLLEKLFEAYGVDGLKPCPFCGGEAVLIEHKTADGTVWKYDGVHGSINCMTDGCNLECNSGFWFDNNEPEESKEEMVKAWNTRANDEQIKAFIEENE